MRLNRFVAQASGMSRRAADEAITQSRVTVDGERAQIGQIVDENSDKVQLDGRLLNLQTFQTILLHKPPGYVVSRAGQGSKTIYDLLPSELHHLKPVGRLDKDSSGLLLLTNDGALAAELTHPKYEKEKVYEVELDRPLNRLHQLSIEKGIELEDGNSHLQIDNVANHTLRVIMHEGRNRQIRRTFAALCYAVTKLKRTRFGPYELEELPAGAYKPL